MAYHLTVYSSCTVPYDGFGGLKVYIITYVLFQYARKDDIAQQTDGVLINRPNGPNVRPLLRINVLHHQNLLLQIIHCCLFFHQVYKGVPKDYTKEHYSLDNFFNVLHGRNTSTGGKTLKSGPNDHVFIYYADHGAPGLSGFCDQTLLATDLNDVRTYKPHYL